MKNVWVSKSRKHGLTNHYFEEGFISMGWSDLPDISTIKTRNELKVIFDESYPGETKMQIANHVGQIWKFLQEVKIGDFIVFPHKDTSTVEVGKIIGEYNYSHTNAALYHNRKVDWLTSFPRSQFDLDLLNSFGSLLTFAGVRKPKAFERIKEMVENPSDIKEKKIPMVELEDPITDLESTATNRLLKFIEEKFSGHPLADIISEILRAKGNVTKVATEGPDGGVDIIAAPKPFGFGNPKIVVQVKSSPHTESANLVRELAGVMEKHKADYGLLAVWGGLTAQAKREARESFPNILWWDQVEIVNQIKLNYEKFSDEMKIKLPLTQIWSLVEDTDN